MGDKDWKGFLDELKKEWKILWRDAIEDKVRAEGIANRDYSLLFVDRGLVINATRDFRPLDFLEILQRHKPANSGRDVIPPSPSVGGWGRFIRNVLSGQKRLTKRGRPVPSEPKWKQKQQLKKGGKGWLHRMR